MIDNEEVFPTNLNSPLHDNVMARAGSGGRGTLANRFTR